MTTKDKFSTFTSIKTGKLNSNAAVIDGVYPFFTCSQETYKTNTYSFDGEYVLLGGNNAAGIYPLKYYYGKFDAYQRTYAIQSTDTQKLKTKYLYYALIPELENLKSISTGATTKFLTITILNNIKINIPEGNVQDKIASVLYAYDKLIENNNKRIKILEEMAQTLYNEWFVNFRFPGHEKVEIIDSEMGKIPEGWKVKSCDELAQYINGFAFNPSHWGNTGYPIVKIAELKNGFANQTNYFHGEGIDERYFINSLDLLFSWSASLGVFYWTNGKSLLNQHIFKVVPHSDVGKWFLFHSLLNALPTFKSMSLGATMQHIKRSALKHVCISLPPTYIVKEFEDIMNPIYENILNLKRRASNLIVSRDLLIPKLISGEIDVSEMDI